jgi:hypothetical protein
MLYDFRHWWCYKIDNLESWLWKTCMIMIFKLLCTCGVSVEAVCVSWLIQERGLGKIFMCQCRGLALLSGSVFVAFHSVVLMLHSKLSFIKARLMMWLNKYCVCMKYRGFAALFWVLALPSCPVVWNGVYVVLYINFDVGLEGTSRTLDSKTKLLYVSTGIYSLPLCKYKSVYFS